MTMSTIGFGDQHPSILHPWGLTAFAVWLLFTVIVTSAVLNYAIKKVASAHEDLLQALCDEIDLDFDTAILSMRETGSPRSPRDQRSTREMLVQAVPPSRTSGLAEGVCPVGSS